MAHRREGDIDYFLFANPARIERFDLAHDRFLGAITLAQTPAAMTTDSGFLYVAFGTSFSQFALDGTNEVPLGSAPETINGMFALNGYLYLVAGDYPQEFRSFDLSTKQFVASTGLSYDPAGDFPSIVPIPWFSAGPASLRPTSTPSGSTPMARSEPRRRVPITEIFPMPAPRSCFPMTPGWWMIPARSTRRPT